MQNYYVRQTKKDISVTFRRDDGFIEQVQFVKNYSRQFECKDKVLVLGGRKPNLASYIASCAYNRNFSTSSGSFNTRTAKLNCFAVLMFRIWNKDGVFTFLKQKSMRTNGWDEEQDLGLVHLDDRTLFTATRVHETISVKDAENTINNYSSFPVLPCPTLLPLRPKTTFWI